MNPRILRLVVIVGAVLAIGATMRAASPAPSPSVSSWSSSSSSSSAPAPRSSLAVAESRPPSSSAVAESPRAAAIPATTAPAPSSAEAGPPPPPADDHSLDVATIDGRPITLRQIEDAMLKKEGAEQIEEWLHHQLEHADWSKLTDDDAILTVAGTALKRKDLVLALLKNDVGRVREDLINIALVENALVKAGVAMDDKTLDAAFASMERKFKIAQKGKPQQVDFASYIQAKEGFTPEELRKQPAFRMFAGVRALVVRQARADLDDTALRQSFEANRERYDQHEAVELSDIYIPFYAKDADKGVVDDEERNRLMLLMLGLWKNIRDGQQDFATTWLNFSKGYNDAGDGGKVGWVRRDGTRERSGRPLPKEVMDLAFKATVFPALLQPTPGPTGVDLARVDAKRAEKPAVFAEVKERVFQDLVEEQIDARTQRVLGDLRRAADIKYASIPDVIERRK